MDLSEFLASQQTKKFKWGEFDCCTIPADAVLAVKGLDFTQNMRGYRSELDAFIAIQKLTGKQTLLDFIDSLGQTNGWKLIENVNEARDLDVCAVSVPHRQLEHFKDHISLSIFYAGFAWTSGRVGLHRVNTDQIVRIWRI